MKKIITVDDIMIAFVASLGYGFGETISRLSGWPELACMGASTVLGVVVNGVISKIAYSETVQRKPRLRLLTYLLFLLIFLIAQTISVVWMGVSMVDYLVKQVVYVIVMPILGFVLNLVIRWFRIRSIRERYGDGSEGYVFDVKREDIEEVNRQNRPVTDDYEAECAVRTRTGVYVGERQLNCITYLGIPYAKPPVGALRWKAPEPLPPSEALFEARFFGASAIQVAHKGSIIKHHRQSEDCLSLNICVNTEGTAAKKPVLVLFHHGDFTSGGSVDPLLSGHSFVEAHPDIVFVSFNYRLGLFGFIDFAGVPGGAARPNALNLGLLDQVAALQWIKENIAAFGGDPDRVTVMGFEAGATSILMLAAGGQARGLFRRAFVFNGNPETVYSTPEASRALASALLQETQTSTMEELLRLNTETLADAAQKLWPNMCGPAGDGVWFPADLYGALQAGAASDIEFIIGIPSNERKVFRSFIGNPNYETLISAIVADMQGIDVPLNDDAQVADSSGLEAKSKLIEQWNALSVYRTAAKLAQGGSRVHVMYWDKKPIIENLGSGTVDAAAALLGNDEALQMYGSVLDADQSELLSTLLLKFICGDALELYSNEIKGVDELDWKSFPQALIVSEDAITCGGIGDRIAAISRPSISLDRGL